MDLQERYLKGDCQIVHAEIERMGPDALSRKNIDMVEAVLRETMQRVADNLAVIYLGLSEARYCFKRNIRHDFEYPLLEPAPNIHKLIHKLEKKVKKFGYVPLSLKLFYEIVGSCNFAWDYESTRDIPWIGADPIQIAPISDLLDEVAELEFEDEESGLPVSADCLHKDNISGGPPYTVELTRKPMADSRFLYEEHETSFVRYLRIAMEGCGFSRANTVSHLESFAAYCNKVRPMLKSI